MNTRMFWKWNLGVGLALLASNGLLRAESLTPPPVLTNAPSPAVVDPNTALKSGIGGTNANIAQPALAEISDAPVTVVQTNRPIPANIKPTGPVSEVIKLANSGMDESIMLAFVTNSASTFNLAAEDIIYLNDLGIPGPVVTAMIQHDQAYRSAPGPALNATLSAPPNPSGEAPGWTAPPPEAVAPQPAEATAPYAAQPPPGEPASFYDSLSPYGTWVDVEGYGQCWQPTVVAVNPGWRPYMDCGHWVYTDAGW